ncbi:RWD domain-containing protein 1 [Blyttiomyces sp. JEL0837]|nr:RWD domain-containing protein 1 [Blyttiomyces sp. JEL0837]
MTDYLEEQNQELEALQSIFFEEFEQIDAGPPASFRLFVKPDDQDDPDDPHHLYLEITYTPTYPDELPQINLTKSPNNNDSNPVTTLTEADITNLTAKVLESANESMGMAMVFALHSVAKESLENLLREKRQSWEKAEDERREREEEAERNRFAGTKVTKESFLAWREGFMKEMAELEKLGLAVGGGVAPSGVSTGGPGSGNSMAANKAAAAAAARAEAAKSRLTGRQLFEKDKSLAKSDMALLGDGDVTVDYDKELFDAEFEGLDDEEEEQNNIIAGFTEDDD